MSVFRLPKWVIRSLDALRRTFLWIGSNNSKQKLVTVSWGTVCSPKKLGGLGVLDLNSFNLALLTKWLWKWTVPDASNWKTLVTTLQLSYSIIPLDSPLSKTFAELLPIFTSITVFSVNSANAIFFWHQNWGLGILSSCFQILFSFCLEPDIMLSDFLANLQDTHRMFRPSLLSSSIACLQLQQLTQALSMPGLLTYPSSQTLPDRLHSKISPNKLTSASVYKFINLNPKVNSEIYHIWSLKIPPRVLTFTWLLLHDKLATIDNLQLRGMTLVNRCPLCLLACESAIHLVNHCPFFLEVKQLVFNSLALTIQTTAPTQSLLVDQTISQKLKGILAIICYIVWRERCTRIFTNCSSTAPS